MTAGKASKNRNKVRKDFVFILFFFFILEGQKGILQPLKRSGQNDGSGLR